MLDLSPSLDFGTASCEKRDLAIAALAAVTHLTRGGGNRIGVARRHGRADGANPRPRWARARAGDAAPGRPHPARPGGHPRRPGRGDRAAAPAAAAPRAGRRDLRLPRRAGLGAVAAGAVGAARPARRRGARPARAGAARRRHGRARRPGDRPAARGDDHPAAVPASSRRRRPSTASGWPPRCAAAGPRTSRCAPTRTGSPTSCGSCWPASGRGRGVAGDLRQPVVAAAVRRGRRAGRRVRAAAAQAPRATPCGSPTWSCSRGSRRSGPGGPGTCRRRR